MQTAYPVSQEDDVVTVSSATIDGGSPDNALKEALTYLSGVSEEQHGEMLYQDFLAAHRRWRAWSGKPTRGKRCFFRRASSKGGTKGSGRGMFGHNTGHMFQPGAIDHSVPSPPQPDLSFAGGRPTRRKNPVGRDGKIM